MTESWRKKRRGNHKQKRKRKKKKKRPKKKRTEEKEAEEKEKKAEGKKGKARAPLPTHGVIYKPENIRAPRGARWILDREGIPPDEPPSRRSALATLVRRPPSGPGPAPGMPASCSCCSPHPSAHASRACTSCRRPASTRMPALKIPLRVRDNLRTLARGEHCAWSAPEASGARPAFPRAPGLPGRRAFICPHRAK